ncbi:MAG TPA: molecular chaperone DnaJ, partial [Cellvibrionaceae bacterium]
RVVVETPVGLSNKQKDLLKQFAETMGSGKNSPRQKNWFEGMKNFFGDMKI